MATSESSTYMRVGGNICRFISEIGIYLTRKEQLRDQLGEKLALNPPKKRPIALVSGPNIQKGDPPSVTFSLRSDGYM